jgi:hypothetical protein
VQGGPACRRLEEGQVADRPRQAEEQPPASVPVRQAPSFRDAHREGEMLLMATHTGLPVLPPRERCLSPVPSVPGMFSALSLPRTGGLSVAGLIQQVAD